MNQHLWCICAAHEAPLENIDAYLRISYICRQSVCSQNFYNSIPGASFLKMKPLHGLFFLTLPTITVLAKPFTNEYGAAGPDDVKCTLSTVSVKHPNNLLTFDDGHCVYSKSIDQCKTGVALLQSYDPQNVCPQGMSVLRLFFYAKLSH